MSWLQIIGLLEALVILVLTEPVLNRMSPCAPFIMRTAFHLIAIGSAFRVYHILSGHPPSWSALLQVGGLALLLICDQLRHVRLVDRRKATREAEQGKPPAATDSVAEPAEAHSHFYGSGQ